MDRFYMKFLTAVATGSILLGSSLVFAEEMDTQTTSTQCIPSQEVVLQQTMRKLWTDHVIWTRCYIISSVANIPDVSAVTARLLKNQEDIGNALIPYYGKDAATALTKLLKEHILIAAALVDAVKKNAKDDEKKTDQKWHDNAAAIADFLSKANSYWPRQDLLTMLNQHLKLTAQEAIYRVQQKWAKDVSNFDQIFNQALEMADTLSAGIAYQFLQKK